MVTGVVVVTYNASDVVIGCLESLLANQGVDLRIVVVDNASSDMTIKTIHDWASGGGLWSDKDAPFKPVPHGSMALVNGAPQAGERAIGLISSAENRGFAGGVNLGLQALLTLPEIDNFWILNPDCMAGSETALKLENCARQAGSFGVIGGRVYYSSPPQMIQSDGGRVNLWTGNCIPFNLARIGRDVPAPENAMLDYIAGSHMLVSRTFLTQAGLMPEDYFLFYEEVDWCLRRGDLPLLLCIDAEVYHDGGHSIGSATMSRGPSPTASYFMGRSRMKFVMRHRPIALPIAFAFNTVKACRYFLRGQYAAGVALLRGTIGMGPSAAVRKHIGRQ